MMLPGFPRPMVMTGGDPFLDLANSAIFDGANDYLLRSSDLSGNTGSKTFTISIWINFAALSSGNRAIYMSRAGPATGNFGFRLQYFSAANYVSVIGPNGSGSNVLEVRIPGANFTAGQFDNVLISVDLANSSNRSVYVNDAPISPTWETYTNDTISFPRGYHAVGAFPDGTTQLFDGRLAHFFLDYTNRDLSNVNNRRLFNDGAGAPAAGQASLSPILYLPLTNTDPFGKNFGTGGDFVVNGDLA